MADLYYCGKDNLSDEILTDKWRHLFFFVKGEKISVQHAVSTNNMASLLRRAKVFTLSVPLALVW
jgi:hypothetical protein